MRVAPRPGLAADILKSLADGGPSTAEAMVARLRAAGQLEPDDKRDKPRVHDSMKNLRQRGRIEIMARGETNGRPAIYSIVKAAEAALTAPPPPRRARKRGKTRLWSERRPKPAPLKPAVATYCRWFLAAGWGDHETARLFGIKPRDLEPLKAKA